MKRSFLLVIALAAFTLVFSQSSNEVKAAALQWRMTPAIMAPSPQSFGPMVSAPPSFTGDSTPMVYSGDRPVAEVRPVGLRYDYRYSLQPDYRFSTRHYRMDYRFRYNGHEDEQGRIRFRYRFNRGRMKAKLRYRP